MRLLLAEDEAMMAEAIVAYLTWHKHQVDWAPDGIKALDLASRNPYDCLILDVMMPGKDGISVLRQLRRDGSTCPAIFLTAKGELDDKTQGFEAGGDDYLTKPFAMEELVLRINALAKRGRAILTEKIRFADLTLDKDACTLSVGEQSCPLSHREFQLLIFFMQNPRVYFSADTLLDRVWGMDVEAEQGTVWTHISYLRKKMETLGSRASIVSKRGIGYALEETK
ncbi:MAG: response regulator transcription factor [Clostridia bacterium]|nr:response regulator transcription factor [Clostridia bacterium]